MQIQQHNKGPPILFTARNPALPGLFSCIPFIKTNSQRTDSELYQLTKQLVMSTQNNDQRWQWDHELNEVHVFCVCHYLMPFECWNWNTWQRTPPPSSLNLIPFLQREMSSTRYQGYWTILHKYSEWKALNQIQIGNAAEFIWSAHWRVGAENSTILVWGLQNPGYMWLVILSVHLIQIHIWLWLFYIIRMQPNICSRHRLNYSPIFWFTHSIPMCFSGDVTSVLKQAFDILLKEMAVWQCLSFLGVNQTQLQRVNWSWQFQVYLVQAEKKLWRLWPCQQHWASEEWWTGMTCEALRILTAQVKSLLIHQWCVRALVFFFLTQRPMCLVDVIWLHCVCIYVCVCACVCFCMSV